MKQILVKSGKVLTANLPAPQLQEGMVKVAVGYSCISPGTEIMGMAASAKKPVVQQILENPKKILKAVERISVQGVSATYRQATGLDADGRPTGYSAAGIVEEVGPDCPDFAAGDRVAIAGAEYAGHVEEAVVPKNLVMKIPDGISLEEASTVALGGIALQGVRRADARLGEMVGVVGCGVLGLLTIQMLRGAGCRTVAMDLDNARLDTAKKLGADYCLNPVKADVVTSTFHFTGGHGLDSVIITAATDSNEPLSQAFSMARHKGRVVLVGVVGPEFDRNDMYAKELDFVISTSYGPGRYDENYERFGKDYPYGYVRWTEKRNMQAYLEMLDRKSIQLKELLNGCYPVDQAAEAFACLQQEPKPLLVTIRYDERTADSPDHATEHREVIASAEWTPPSPGEVVRIGLIGVGAFVKSMHLPNITQMDQNYQITWVVDQSPPNAHNTAKKIAGCKSGTDVSAMLRADDVDAVLIGTRHNNHAEMVQKALHAGKAVFVEKPMCLASQEYGQLCDTVNECNAPFMVGYNRRFSPHAQRLKKLISNRINPLMAHYTMNAGYLPYTHWTQTEEGGGRILGEACHILDLFRYLIGAPACSLSVDAIDPHTESVRSSDNCVITLKYQDGSVCTLLYTAIGDSSLPKEKLEIFCDQKSYLLNDYREICGADNFQNKEQDKGHAEELEQFYTAITQNNRFPIPWDELCETWELSFRIANALSAD